MSGQPRWAGLGTWVWLVAAAAWLPAEDALQKQASWTQPSLEAVKAQLDQWLAERQAKTPLDELARARIDALWAGGSGDAFADERLERLAASFAVVDPEAREVVDFCQRAERPLQLPAFAFLAREDTPPLVRNNLKLYLGRCLSQHQLYDESLAWIDSLEPADVADSAALLFYQGVAHHRLLDKEKCLPKVARLLENKDHLPRRYVTVALLMESDIKPLKPDSLDEVARLMDDVERRLGFGRAGTRVRQTEDEVIVKLDKMIEELEEQLKKSKSSSGSSGGAQAAQPMQDSMPGGGSGPGDVEQRRTGSRAGWGNLPPKERQEALQRIAKGLPSHYRDVIEEYFRKLARDGNN